MDKNNYKYVVAKFCDRYNSEIDEAVSECNSFIQKKTGELSKLCEDFLSLVDMIGRMTENVKDAERKIVLLDKLGNKGYDICDKIDGIMNGGMAHIGKDGENIKIGSGDSIMILAIDGKSLSYNLRKYIGFQSKEKKNSAL